MRDRQFYRELAPVIMADRVRCWLWLIILLWQFNVGSHSAVNFDRMLEAVVQRGGHVAAQKFQAWRSLVQAGKSGSDLDQLAKVNSFFNRQISFVDDVTVWGQVDYWATPLETLGQGRGDCEDYVIAKYFTLRHIGISPDRLRLVYVRARAGTGDAVAAQAHMVLAYYAQPDAEPLVLDNLISDIRTASRRPDLVPVYSFNNEGVFSGSPGVPDVKIGGIGRLSRWEDLLRRARAEGFE
ncbi:MAG: hypothetical protein RL710_2381 [Pseudomonadota bacterium]